MLEVESLGIPNVKKISQRPQNHTELMTGENITWSWRLFRKVVDTALKPIVMETEIHIDRALSLRGMYYTVAPRTNSLFIRALSGSVYVNALDLRENSRTYGKSTGCEISAENKAQIYIPEDFAWGLLSLSDDTLLICKSSNYISDEYTGILNYADPALNIYWPEKPVYVSPLVKFAPGISDFEARTQMELIDSQETDLV